MQHFNYLLNIFHGAGALIGFVLWVIFIAKYRELDAISLYSLDRAMPTPDTAFVNQGNSAVKRVISAQTKMTQDCLFPFIQTEIQSKIAPGDTATVAANKVRTWLTDNDLDVDSASAFQSTLSRLHVEAWNPDRSRISLPDAGLPSPTHFPPVCRCMAAVFDKYKTQTSPDFDTASTALKACLATRQQIPRQTILFHSTRDDTAIAKRKCFSRSALVLTISLAVLGNLLYRMIDRSDGFRSSFCSSGQYIWTPLILTVICAFVLPVANTELNSNAVMSLQAGTFLPALLVFIVVESVWWLNGKLPQRYIYPHPFFFCLTLSSLYTIALIENGVYTQDVLFSFWWLSATVSCAYACIVFSATHNATQHERSRSGQLLLIVVVALAVVVKLIPTFPVNSELNVLWLLPAIYIGVVVGGVVFVEMYYAHNRKGEPNQSQETAAHMIDFGVFLVFAVVLWYFFTQLAYIATGDAIFTNAGQPSSKLNFELAEVGTPLYSQPGMLRVI